MNDESSQLPWDQLQHSADRIPWPALHAFADAVVTDSGVMKKLFEVYDQAYREAEQQATYGDFYVAAIFALAAPRLDEQRRREIGAFLVERLVQAGRDGANVSLEVLQAAAGTMGPVIVPAVLDAIAKEPDTLGAWLFLWTLTKLAIKSQDEAVHSRVIQACVNLLEKVERDEADPGDGMNAAWTLALFQRPEHTDLLRRLSEKPKQQWWTADYQGALSLQEGRSDYIPVPELWEQPVEKWLTSRCRMVEEDAGYEYAEETIGEETPEEEQGPDWGTATFLAAGFVLSPVAAGLPPELRDDAHVFVERLVYFSLSELDTSPRDWDEAALRALLLDIVPRRFLADRRQLEKIIPVMEALLHWLQFDGMLDDGDALAGIIHNWSDQLIAAGMDARRWGSIKTAAMKAINAGLDINEPQVRKALLEQSAAPFYEALPEPEPAPRNEPPIPIVEHSPKPARNAPCPCGSGKKYKKCHGRPEAEQTANL